MAIYYTRHEGGNIYWCPIKSQHSKVIKYIKKRKNFLKSVGEIHSVFFTKNKRVTKIWDSSVNRYRVLPKTNKIIIPPLSKEKKRLLLLSEFKYEFDQVFNNHVFFNNKEVGHVFYFSSEYYTKEESLRRLIFNLNEINSK